MEHPTIPLQRSFAWSLGVHVLIFGTALAFAHYGDILVGGTARVIAVDLVGGPGEQGRGGSPVAHSEQAARENIAQERHEPPAQESMNRSDAPVVPAGPSDVSGGELPGTGAAPSAGTALPAGEGTAAASGEAGGAAGSPSPEQWQMLRAAIEKAKDYPRLARERGIEGIVLLRFRTLPSGGVGDVGVVKSSGAAILDEASVKTVRRAGPMPYVQGWVEVPLVYELK